MNQLPRAFKAGTLATILIAAIAVGSETSAIAQTAPNGRIAFSSWDEDLNYDIYTVDPADPSTAPVRLTTDGAFNGNPDYSPDGTKIIYDGWSTFSGPRIQVMDTNPATDDSVVLSKPCSDDLGCYGDFQPAWSPDGTRIAFVSSRPNADGSENWSYEIYVMDATGEAGPLPRATRLTTDPLPESGQAITDSQITWSPDGKQMAFLSEGRGFEADSCDLWVMDSRDLNDDGFGDNLQQLTFDDSFNCDPFEDVSPQWSPNSSLIAFTSTRSGYFDIWIVNADDPTDLRNVTGTPEGYEDQPGWSPDSAQIVFRSDASGAYEFYSLPVPPPATAGRENGLLSGEDASLEPTQLTFDGSDKQHPDWGALRGSRPGTVTLNVSKKGLGNVATASARITCGRHCTATFVRGSKVKLKATPRAGYRFARWDGACAGMRLACTLQMKRTKSVIAWFAQRR